MRNLAVPVVLALLFCPVVALAEVDDDSSRPLLTGDDRVGKDPMIVVLLRIENVMDLVDGLLDKMTRITGEITAEKIESSFADAEEELGFPVRDDLLEQLGPEFGLVIDLPPLDTIFEQAPGFPGTAASILAGTGVFARIRDMDKVDRSIRKLIASAETAEVVDGEDGLTRVRLPLPSPASGQDSALEFVYGIRDGWLALGMNADWVEATLAGPEAGQRLADGADYARVMSNLDEDPYLRAYANLPALLDSVKGSNMLKMMLGANDEATRMMETFGNDEYFGIGWGYTSIEVDGGVRASNYGPAALTGAGMYTGIVAAIAIPNFLNAIDRGKQKRSMVDLRIIGAAVESFSIDNNLYPTTDGWQTAEVLVDSLQPVYVRTLPLTDGWGNAFHVWADGESYVLVSAGKDGELDRDWLGFEAGATTLFNADIVFKNGQFVSWPEGNQQ